MTLLFFSLIHIKSHLQILVECLITIFMSDCGGCGAHSNSNGRKRTEYQNQVTDLVFSAILGVPRTTAKSRELPRTQKLAKSSHPRTTAKSREVTRTHFCQFCASSGLGSTDDAIYNSLVSPCDFNSTKERILLWFSQREWIFIDCEVFHHICSRMHARSCFQSTFDESRRLAPF